MNINEIGAKTCHCCEGEAPMSMDSRTIKDNIRETTEQLHIIEGMVDSLSRMLWAKDAVNEKSGIDIIDMDSNIVHNLDTARQIRNKMERITRGLGKSEKYLVDELQMMLSAMNVEAATVDCDCIEVLRGQQKEGL